ncbi:MAG: addiction module protein [Bacteroidota bacterium]
MKTQIQDQQIKLTEKQKEEVLRREKAFAEGKATARPWKEIKKDLEKVYR